MFGDSVRGRGLPGDASPSPVTPEETRAAQAKGLAPEMVSKIPATAIDSPGVRSPLQSPGSSKGTWAKLLEAFKQLPGSFKLFLAGSGLLAAAGEGIAIIYQDYGFANFGLVPGILLSVVGIVFRIPGSLLGARMVKRFDAKKIYISTTAVMGFLLLSLPFGSWLWGNGAAYLALNFLVQFVSGLIYGATRGMAENQIMPRLVGQDKKQLEIAGFLFMATIEAFALAAAWGLTPVLKAAFGVNPVIGIFGAMMFSSLFFFRKMTLREEGEGSVDEQGGTQDRLPLREYIPYVASTFVHFVFYSLFVGVFSQYIFHSINMPAFTTGSYDTGSLVIGLIAAIPALIASLGAGPEAGSSEGKKDPIDRIPLWGLFGLAVLASTAYLWLGLGGFVIMSLVAAGVLGAVITANRTKWMASYLNRLKPEHHAKVIARLNSVSTAVALLPFAAISIGTIMGADIRPLLFWSVMTISAGLALAWSWTRRPKAGGAG